MPTPASSKKAIQRLAAILATDPKQAKQFVASPVKVAERHGIKLTAEDANVIKDVLGKLGLGKTGVHEQHADFPECDHIEVGRPSDIRILTERELKARLKAFELPAGRGRKPR